MAAKLNLIFGYVTSVIFLVCLNSFGWSAEKAEVPAFKNVDEAIGWIKGKGRCGGPADKQFCFIEIALPAIDTEKDRGRRRPLSWAVVGIFQVYTFGSERSLHVEIVRSRTVPLSQSDSTSLLRVVKRSKYHFNSQGRIDDEAQIRVEIENSNQELIFDLEVPAARLRHGDGLADLILLGQHLGFKWDFAK